jgi:hypothetical protein
MKEHNLPFEEDEWIESVGGNGGGTDTDGRDELNLAEFPIAALTDRIPDGQMTLVFEDTLERRNSPPIVRRLTIMGTAKRGLPTSVDDEVLVGLIQLTKRRSNFADNLVYFSRYELIELLGWPQSGASYKRIEESLNRWVSITLMYENAWWDNAAKSWVDETFHVLDNVSLYDREGKRRASRPSKGNKAAPVRAEKAPLPLSKFKWNEVIFRSFQSGNLKQLDLEFYLGLRLPTTKRMFRFLDKRFYRRTRLDFDLRTLACEHIGMSRSYAPTELKRRLQPAIDELERLGFLEPLSAEERYASVSRGCWRIILIRAGASGAAGPVEPNALIAALVDRGVTPKAAAELVGAHPPARVRTKVEVFDWLVENRDKRVDKNPAGYLVASIRDDYRAPEAFKPAAEVVRAGEAALATGRAELEAKERARAEILAARIREANLRGHWERLPEAERDAILQEVKAENPGLARFRKMLEPLALAALARRLESGGSAASPGGAQRTLFDAP